VNVTIAKRNPVKGLTTFYVASETNPSKRYAVQRIVRKHKTSYFCNCADFTYRHLPHLDTNTFSGCKHIKAARRTS
jgi:hypothetical protein